jgi:uroporphyrinogen decarboxylase
LRDEASIRALGAPDPAARLRYVLDAVREIRKALAGRVPLIGFSGSPFTLACYMVEGAGSDDWRELKTMLYARPDLLHRVLEVNARAVTDYLNAQIDAGAQVVMIFDTWGGQLGHADYETFSLAYARRVIAGLRKESEGRRVPSILFTKGGGAWLEQMAASGCDAVGLDWTVDPAAARVRVGTGVSLQGNLDPSALFAPPERVREQARRVLDAFGAAPGHVFNLGHGISQHTPVESVAALVDEVRTYSTALRRAAQKKT